jgi:DNA-binding response OmpR family regulator
MNILLVDGHHDLVEVLSYALRRAGFMTFAAADPTSALRILREKRPDLAILEIDLGSWNGFDLLTTIRRLSDIPIIMLTERDTEDDRIQGLDLGADDYVTKPFSHRELLGRIRAHLRRRIASPQEPSSAVLQAGSISFNVAEHTATHDGQRVDLTANEFRLLHYLAVNAGHVVSTEVILKEIWGQNECGNSDVVRSTVCRLRRKLNDDPTNPRLLRTVRGVGVLLKTDPAHATSSVL